MAAIQFLQEDSSVAYRSCSIQSTQV